MISYFELIKNKPELFDNQNAMIKIITDKERIQSWEQEQKSKLSFEGKPEKWGKIGIVYDDPYIMILRDLVQFPTGKVGSYFRLINTADLLGGRGVAIIPIIKEKIVLLRQFRHPTRSWHWEIPRGFGEPNLSPEENVIKEIDEEIEGEISRLIYLGTYHCNTGVEGVLTNLYFAKLKKVGKPNQDEGIKYFQQFSKSEVENMIINSQITDGFTIAAFTRILLKSFI